MIGRVYRWGNGYWRVVCRAQPFSTKRGGPARNVLIEQVEHASHFRYPWEPTGARVVRPFRGLKRIR